MVGDAAYPTIVSERGLRCSRTIVEEVVQAMAAR